MDSRSTLFAKKCLYKFQQTKTDNICCDWHFKGNTLSSSASDVGNVFDTLMNHSYEKISM